jgi:hypothetical protein
MTGQTSLHYAHCTRPEGYEEDDEEHSEGEGVAVLKARTGNPKHSMNDEDDQFWRQDLALTRVLQLRAERLEKVIMSVLDQPLPIHPLMDNDVSSPPQPPIVDMSDDDREPPPLAQSKMV